MVKVVHTFFLLFSLSVSAQKITSAAQRQEQNNIIVSYKLETESPCKINLYLSKNGGKNWIGPLHKVKGDVGENIRSGDHSITWSVLEEFEELRGEDIKFEVRIESEQVNSPQNNDQEINALITVPNQFTPNGDGMNDDFKPNYFGISEIEYFNIYNRYGTLIFFTRNKEQSWNGTYKGKEMPVGRYVWMFQGLDASGKTTIIKGVVEIVR